MANNKGPVDLGSPNVDPFGDDQFDFPDFDQADDRDPVTAISTGVLSGLKQTAKSPSFYRGLIGVALPRGYSDAIDTIVNVSASGEKLYNETRNSIAPAAKELARSVRSVKQKFEDYLPEKLSKWLDKVTEPSDSNDYRPTSQEEYDRDEIQRTLAATFKVQNEQYKAQRAEDLVQRQVEQKRAMTMAEQLEDLRHSSARIASYNDNIAIAYQRKSLELQYRQVFLARDQLAVTRAGIVETTASLKGILKNTGLPDILKMQTSELAGQMFEEKLIGGLQGKFANSQFGQNTRAFMDRLFENIGQQVKERVDTIKDGFYAASTGLDAVADGAEDTAQLSTSQRYEMGGNVVGAGALEQFAQWGGRKYRDRLAQNPKVGVLGSKLSRYSNNAGAYIQDWAKSDTDYMSPGAGIIDFVKSVIPQDLRQTQVKTEGLNEARAPSYWSNQDSRSLREIIPGFLARILQSSERHRLGTENVELQGFDFRTQKWTSRSNIDAAMRSTVGNQRELQRTAQTSEQLVDQLDPKKSLQPATRKALQAELFRRSQTDPRFNPKTWADEYELQNAFNPAQAAEIAEVIRDTLELDAEGNVANTVSAQQAYTGAMAGFKELKETMPELRGAAQRYVNVGELDNLRQLGLIKTIGMNDYVNEGTLFERFKDYLNGETGDASGMVPPMATADVNRVRAAQSQSMASPTDTRTYSTAGQFSSTGFMSADPSLLLGGFRESLAEQTRQLLEAEALHSAKPAAEEAVALLKQLITAAEGTRQTIAEQTQTLYSELRNNAEQLLTAAMERGSDTLSNARREVSLKGNVNNALGAFSTFGESMRSKAQSAGDFVKGKWDSVRGRNAPTGPVEPAAAEPEDKDGYLLTGRAKRWIRNTGKAAWNVNAGLLKAGFKLPTAMIQGAIGAGKLGLGLGSGIVDSLQRKIVRDVYVNGQLRMTALGMRGGRYVDVNTGTVVKNLKDITGAVKDLIEDQIVLTGDEFAKGLRGADGELLVRTGVKWVADKLVDIGGKGIGLLRGSFALPTAILGTMGKVAKGTLTALLARPKDVYVVGESEPRLTAMLMRKNAYFSKTTGKPIRKPQDIDGTVVDADGEILLDIKDISKGLVDSEGKPFPSLLRKFAGIVGKGIGMAAGVASKVAGIGLRAVRGSFSLANSVAKGGLNVLRGLAPSVHFGGQFGGGDASVESIDVLKRIYNLLLAKFGIDGDPLPLSEQPKAATKQWFKGLWNKARGRDDEDVDSDLDNDGKVSLRERLGNRLGGLKRKVTGLFTRKESTEKPAKEKSEGSGLFGKLMAAVTGIFGFVKGGFGQLKSLVSGFTALRTAIMALSTAKAGGEAIDALGGLDTPDGKGKGKGGLLRRMGRGLKGAGKWVGRGALALAGALPSLSTIGGALSTAGAAAGAVLSSPVTLTIGAIAAVGVAGYYTYKYFSKGISPLRKVRYTQYGIPVGNTDAITTVANFEAAVLKETTFSNRSPAKIDGKIDVDYWMGEFGMNPENPRDRATWLGWVERRFKPVFLSHVTVLSGLAPEVKLEDIDDKLKPELHAAFLKGVRFPQGQLEQWELSPFKDIPLERGSKAIATAFSEAEAAVKDVKPTNVSALPTTAQRDAKGTPSLTYTANAAPTTVDGIGKTYSTKASVGNGTPLLTAGSTVDLKTLTARNTAIDELAALRAKLYGLTELGTRRVNRLLQLEAQVLAQSTYSAGQGSQFSGDVQALWLEHAGAFNGTPTDADAKAQWLYWFQYRFLPIALNYNTAVRKYGATPDSAQRALTAVQLASVAEVLVGTKVTTADGAVVSIWDVDVSGFIGTPVNRSSESVKAYLTVLAANAAKAVYSEPTGVMKLNAALQDGKGSITQLGLVQPNAYKASDVQRVGQSARKGGLRGGNSAALMRSQQVLQSNAGVGGAYADIPEPKGDGNYAAYKDLLDRVAEVVGVDPTLLATMANAESSFRATAKASTSRAAGLFQFVPSTWRWMIDRYGSKYGIPVGTKPNDPRASALMAAEYIRENQQALEKSLNRGITSVDAYAAHFLGPNGALKLLTADPNATAASILPSAAAANTPIFYDQKRPRTVAEVIALLERKVSTLTPSAATNNVVRLPTAPPKEPTVPTTASTTTIPTVATPPQTPGYIASVEAVKQPTLAEAAATPVARPMATTGAVNAYQPQPTAQRVAAQVTLSKQSEESLTSINSTLTESLVEHRKMRSLLERLVEQAEQDAVKTAPTPTPSIRTASEVPKPMIDKSRKVS